MAKKKVGKKPAAGRPEGEAVQTRQPSASEVRFAQSIKEFSGEPKEGEDPVVKVSTLIGQFEEMARANLELKTEIDGLRAVAAVQDPKLGGSRIVSGEEPFRIEQPEGTGPGSKDGGAVFRSPYPGFKQVIKRSNTVHHPNGEYHVQPPLVAEFTKGLCILYDEEEIELMRKKLKEKETRGELDFIEVTNDEVKKAALQGTAHIVSPTVTTETPMDALI